MVTKGEEVADIRREEEKKMKRNEGQGSEWIDNCEVIRNEKKGSSGSEWKCRGRRSDGM